MNKILTTLFILLLCSSLTHAGHKQTPTQDEPINTTLEKAEKGDMDAEFKLGYIYYNGEGAEVNYKKSAKWFKKAAKQGHAEAQFNLAVIYKNGEGLTKDTNKALKWYTKAAKQGLAEAQFNLGYIYYRGEITKVDYLLAYTWTSLASSQTNYDLRAKSTLNNIVKLMTEEEISKAQKLTKEYSLKYIQDSK